MMSETEAWDSLRTLQSCLAGRLVRFTRRAKTDSADALSQQGRNDAAFFEADLRYILTLIPLVSEVPDGDSNAINEAAHELLSCLDDIVNKGVVQRWKLDDEEASGDIHRLSQSLSLTYPYPRLRSVIAVLESSTDQFNLASRHNASIFTPPDGQARSTVTSRVALMKQHLERLTIKSNNHQSAQIPQSPLPSRSQADLNQRYASAVVNQILAGARERRCEKRHEVKLKITDDFQTNESRKGLPQAPLDMFVSCCLDEKGWHQAKCGHFSIMSEGRKDGMCAAIQRAKAQGRAIYLFVDGQGLLDVSDTMPPILASATQFTAETLEELLVEGALTRITPGDYLTGAAVKKFSSREKALLALSLAKCLMEFFDDDIELASHSWKPESIFFLREQRRDRSLYLSLRPCSRASPQCGPSIAVGPGNPILLSFAKLLLEIENGEKIDMRIHSDSRANLPTWGGMCDLVDKVERDGGGTYLQAVEGCLYLHMALRKAQDKSPDVIRQTIRDKVVRNLELVVDPQTTKRKRRDSVSELPLTKKLSFGSSPIPMPTPPEYTSPTNRDGFDVAIVCALPIEFDAVCALVDEFWEGDYGRVNGDVNMYTNGRIGKTNVVLLLLSNMGKVSAASTCSRLRLSYPRLSLVLVTGICGGVPFPSNSEELLLGDVVISRHIVQYDLGRRYPDQFEPKNTAEDSFGRASKSVRNLITLLQTNIGREKLEALTATHLQDIQSRPSRRYRGIKYQYPGASQDRLFQPGYTHKRHMSSMFMMKASRTSTCMQSKSHGSTCDEIGCDIEQVIQRERIELKLQLEADGLVKDSQAPSIFVGTIGSGDTVMKSGKERDRIASAHDLLAFEMEGAGVWDELPCIVVKGICDYADSHKNKHWQPFAAATAASATKGLLSWYIQRG